MHCNIAIQICSARFFSRVETESRFYIESGWSTMGAAAISLIRTRTALYLDHDRLRFLDKWNPHFEFEKL